MLLIHWLTASPARLRGALRRSGLLTVARSRLRLAGGTVRFRLTVLDSRLFLAAGAGLLAFPYLLVDRSTVTALFVSGKDGAEIAVKGSPAGAAGFRGSGAYLRNGSPTAHQ